MMPILKIRAEMNSTVVFGIQVTPTVSVSWEVLPVYLWIEMFFKMPKVPHSPQGMSCLFLSIPLMCLLQSPTTLCKPPTLPHLPPETWQIPDTFYPSNYHNRAFRYLPSPTTLFGGGSRVSCSSGWPQTLHRRMILNIRASRFHFLVAGTTEMLGTQTQGFMHAASESTNLSHISLCF